MNNWYVNWHKFGPLHKILYADRVLWTKSERISESKHKPAKSRNSVFDIGCLKEHSGEEQWIQGNK